MIDNNEIRQWIDCLERVIGNPNVYSSEEDTISDIISYFNDQLMGDQDIPVDGLDQMGQP